MNLKCQAICMSMNGPRATSFGYKVLYIYPIAMNEENSLHVYCFCSTEAIFHANTNYAFSSKIKE